LCARPPCRHAWQALLQCTALRELNIHRTFTLPLTDAVLALMAVQTPQLEVSSALMQPWILLARPCTALRCTVLHCAALC